MLVVISYQFCKYCNYDQIEEKKLKNSVAGGPTHAFQAHTQTSGMSGFAEPPSLPRPTSLDFSPERIICLIYKLPVKGSPTAM